MINLSFLLYLKVILADVLKTIYTSHEAVSSPVKVLINLFALSSLICLEIF